MVAVIGTMHVGQNVAIENRVPNVLEMHRDTSFSDPN
jgi:hypothetical protein